MIWTDNVAGRLWVPLNRAQELLSRPTASSAWAEIWGVSEADHSTLLRRGADMIDMGRQVRNQMSSVDEAYSPDLLLDQFASVERTLPNFLGLGQLTMNQFMGAVDVLGMNALRFCANVLHKQRPEPLLPSELVAEYLEKVNALIATLEADYDLDASTREFALDRLRAVSDALMSHALTGDARVTESVDTFTGSLVRDAPEVKRLRSDRRAFLKDAVLVIGALGSALGMFQQVHDMIEPKPEPSPMIVQIYNVGDAAPRTNVPENHSRDEIVDAEIVPDDEHTRSEP